MIHCELEDRVAVLRIEHGKVNAIDTELFLELSSRLGDLESSDIGAVVLTGTGKAFSAGVDLFRILEGGEPYVRKFIPAFVAGLERLFLFPKPVVAAVNGHAIAGGCVLTCACDLRLMAAGAGTIGIPELLVGVPFPPVALQCIQLASNPASFQELVYLGQTYQPEEALLKGLIDRITSTDELLPAAKKVAADLAAIPAPAFRLTKHQVRLPIAENARSSMLQDEIMEAWCAPQTHEAVRQYLGKTLGKTSR